MRTQTVAGASVILGEDHNEHDTDSSQTDNLQGTGQTEPIVSTNDSAETSRSIAESSGQTLPQIAASLSSLPDIGEDGLGWLIFQNSRQRRSSSNGRACLGRVLVRARAAVVGCRLGGKVADGTRLYPELQERTCARGTPQDIEGGKRKHSQM